MNNGVCQETRNRIHVAVAAYAYEVKSDPILTDAEFDQLAEIIDPSVDTGRPDVDEFFRQFFDPSTGMWVNQHPEPEGLERIYKLMKKIKLRSYDHKNNRDLFGTILKEPPFRACSRCGKNTAVPITSPGACCC